MQEKKRAEEYSLFTDLFTIGSYDEAGEIHFLIGTGIPSDNAPAGSLYLDTTDNTASIYVKTGNDPSDPWQRLMSSFTFADDSGNSVDVEGYSQISFLGEAETQTEISGNAIYVKNIGPWKSPFIEQRDAPPVGPNDGDRYLIGTSPSGVWVGHDNSIAEFDAVTVTWAYFVPDEGWVAWNRDTTELWNYDGAAWSMFGISGFSGVSGFSGYSGATGDSGASGATGPSGGDSGASGVSGEAGASGVSGATGDSGVSGVAGHPGDSGVSGAAGDSGASGASGVAGLSGVSGIAGLSGVSGYSGKSGYSGISGYSGKSGYSGYSGVTGVSGFSGYSGVSGTSGSQYWTKSGTNLYPAVAGNDILLHSDSSLGWGDGSPGVLDTCFYRGDANKVFLTSGDSLRVVDGTIEFGDTIVPNSNIVGVGQLCYSNNRLYLFDEDGGTHDLGIAFRQQYVLMYAENLVGGPTYGLLCSIHHEGANGVGSAISIGIDQEYDFINEHVELNETTIRNPVMYQDGDWDVAGHFAIFQSFNKVGNTALLKLRAKTSTYTTVNPFDSVKLIICEEGTAVNSQSQTIILTDSWADYILIADITNLTGLLNWVVQFKATTDTDVYEPFFDIYIDTIELTQWVN